jgi:hypothetical protein
MTPTVYLPSVFEQMGTMLGSLAKLPPERVIVMLHLMMFTIIVDSLTNEDLRGTL